MNKALFLLMNFSIQKNRKVRQAHKLNISLISKREKQKNFTTKQQKQYLFLTFNQSLSFQKQKKLPHVGILSVREQKIRNPALQIVKKKKKAYPYGIL